MERDDIQEFQNILNRLEDITLAEKKDALIRFTNAIEKGDFEPFFPILAEGAYKICCDFTSNYVIKFCYSSFNFYEVADNNEMWEKLNKRIFLPEYGFELSRDYFSTYTDSFYDEDDDDDYPYIAFVIIQPRISITCANDHDTDDYYLPYVDIQDLSLPSPLIDKTTSRHLSNDEAQKAEIDDTLWLQTVIDCYGVDFFHRLTDLIDNYGLEDLHRNNIGFIKRGKTKIPVIIDF